MCHVRMSRFAHIYIVAIRVRYPYDLLRVTPYLVPVDVVFGGVAIVVAFSLRLVSTRICCFWKR